MPTANRRHTPRLLTCVPAGVQTSEKERLGLLRDASTEGALLFTKSRFSIDDRVKLSVRVDEDTTIEISGRIVRLEKQTDGFWTFRLGVRFVPPREDLAPLFKTLAERQERLFGTSKA